MLLQADQLERRLGFGNVDVERTEREGGVGMGARAGVDREPGPAIIDEPFPRDAVEHRVLVLQQAADQVLVGLVVLGGVETEFGGEQSEDLVVGFGFAHRGNRRSVERDVEMAPCRRKIEMLDLGGRRKDEVGVTSGVGQELLRHDREEILTVETLDDAVLIGSDDRRVAVVDEQGLDRWIDRGVGEHLAEAGHIEAASGWRESGFLGFEAESFLPPDLGRTGEPATRIPPGPGHGRQHGDRTHDLATVAPMFRADE